MDAKVNRHAKGIPHTDQLVLDGKIQFNQGAMCAGKRGGGEGGEDKGRGGWGGGLEIRTGLDH